MLKSGDAAGRFAAYGEDAQGTRSEFAEQDEGQAPWVDNVSPLSCASSQRRRKLVIDDDGSGIG